MKRVDRILYNMYFALYLVVIALGSRKLYPVLSQRLVDLLDTVVAVAFGLYFLYRWLTRYRGDKAASQDCIFLVIFSLVTIIICNFL